MNDGARAIPPWFVERWAAAAPWPRYAGLWRQAAGWRSRRQAREDYNLYAVLAGSAEVQCGERSLRLEAGWLVLIPPGQPFSDGDPDGRGTEMLSAGFAFAAGGDPLAALGLPAAVAAAEPQRLAAACRELALLGSGPAQPAQRMAARAELDGILARFVADGFAAGAFPLAAPVSPPPWLWQVLDEVERRLAFTLTVPGLARLAGLSEAHFSRRFAACMRCPPRTWIRDRRMARARALLMAEPRLQAAEVARLCGFGDPFQFSRMFHRCNGAPPDAWRRAHAPRGEAGEGPLTAPPARGGVQPPG
jgi:AraC-like DNA-binding protein